MASWGDRPRGSLYLVAKNIIVDRSDIFYGTDSIVDGLSLEEMPGGRVRIVANNDDDDNNIIGLPTSGFFSGLRLNNGDCILSVGGLPIGSIADVRRALEHAAMRGRHASVPILTYNVFRRLKTTVMTAMVCRNCTSFGRERRDSATTMMMDAVRPVNIEDTYDVQEKVSGRREWRPFSFVGVRIMKDVHKRQWRTCALSRCDFRDKENEAFKVPNSLFPHWPIDHGLPFRLYR